MRARNRADQSLALNALIVKKWLPELNGNRQCGEKRRECCYLATTLIECKEDLVHFLSLYSLDQVKANI